MLLLIISDAINDAPQQMRIIKYIAGMNSNQPLWIYYIHFIQK